MNVRKDARKVRVSTVLAGLAAVVTIVGCSTVAAAPNASPAQVTRPEAVVQEYYDWYAGYGREAGGNALADGAYQTRDLLAEAFVADVEALLASCDKGGSDPFLCAQDVPQRLTVGNVNVDGDQATVVMDALYAGNPMAAHLTVNVQRGGEGWKIAAVECGTPQPTPLTAQQTVQNFYDLYLEASSRRNLLAEGAYRDMPFLAEELIEKVDALLASFDKGAFDPFLCAQDVPAEVEGTGAQIESERATVELSTSFEGHSLTVTTDLRDGACVITDVTCAR